MWLTLIVYVEQAQQSLELKLINRNVEVLLTVARF